MTVAVQALLHRSPHGAKHFLDGDYFGGYIATPKKIWVHQKPVTQLHIYLLIVCLPH